MLPSLIERTTDSLLTVLFILMKGEAKRKKKWRSLLEIYPDYDKVIKMITGIKNPHKERYLTFRFD